MPEIKKRYGYYTVEVTRSSGPGEPTTAMVQTLNKLGEAGYHFVSLISYPTGDAYILMEQERDKQ